ncbi:Hydrolase, putative, cyclic phosphodiesterase-like domain-containing (fragment) [uncultured Desulfatiglans sp.]|uniref:Hydrolase, putative, cyclic phosphodiesterase-like domain-containing n=1 Tax=Uncultured Desulfatiglans sp. TaxID=1748965 RepID=A0A653A540_UNCDX
MRLSFLRSIGYPPKNGGKVLAAPLGGRGESRVFDMQGTCRVDVLLFDYGGVLAEEGFREGLKAIALKNGLDPDAFFQTASEWVHASGYVTGKASEQTYWRHLRRETGIQGSDADLRREILDRFVLRDWMVRLVRVLKEAGVRLAILSDQTDWLVQLDRRDRFFQYFEAVFNSFVEGRSKRDSALFDQVVGRLGTAPSEVLFMDDNPGNIERARSRGLETILYRDRRAFLADLVRFCPFLEASVS